MHFVYITVCFYSSTCRLQPTGRLCVAHVKVHDTGLTGCWSVVHMHCNCTRRMIVIAEDAVVIEPTEVGSIHINTGQRYDVLVCQRLPPGASVSTAPVWIRATMIDDNFPSPRHVSLRTEQCGVACWARFVLVLACNIEVLACDLHHMLVHHLTAFTASPPLAQCLTSLHARSSF